MLTSVICWIFFWLHMYFLWILSFSVDLCEWKGNFFLSLISWRSGKNLHCIQCNQCICMSLWFYCGIIEIALHLQKKHKKKNEKWGKRWGWILRVVLSKNGGMFREIVRFFMGKKIVTYHVVIHCILYSLRIRLFTRICMRHKLITIVTDKNKRLFTQCFSSHFILIIHCYHWYQEWICYKLCKISCWPMFKY